MLGSSDDSGGGRGKENMWMKSTGGGGLQSEGLQSDEEAAGGIEMETKRFTQAELAYEKEPIPPPETAVCVEPSCRLFGYSIALKHIALVALVAQTVGSILMLRLSRVAALGPGEHRYLNTTAVFMSEILKLIFSVRLVVSENKGSFIASAELMRSEILGKPIETLKVGIPAFLYTIQNNLIFVALSNMSGALYQITYQMKILTTALLSVLLLQKHLTWSKWASLLFLTGGVALIQIPPEGSGGGKGENLGGNPVIGFVAVACACMTSGFAGVYFEKILKESKTSIWLRNIQLAIFGSTLALGVAFWNDSEAIFAHGFFQGYNWMTWSAVLLQSAGGLIVAAVLKYADNILKCFGNALAIVLSCGISWLMKDFTPSQYFVVGTVFVLWATYQYSVDIVWSKVFAFFQCC